MAFELVELALGTQRLLGSGSGEVVMKRYREILVDTHLNRLIRGRDQLLCHLLAFLP